MLSQSIRDAVRATAPLLKENGETLTRHFYARMFRGNPELREVFNQGHQQGGQQQRALAAAVAAYAEHIDDPSVLAPVVNRIVHKHVSLGIRAEHYPIVGRHLLASISEVLGDLASEALLEAWAAAYGQLADLLIAEESRLYHASAQRPGGWTGWRSFRVAARHRESAEIVSFELMPADGGEVPEYLPGQYVSVRVLVPELGFTQARQYSLSDAPGHARLRISVKRERGAQANPDGMVSGILHERVQVGDVVEVAPPMGDFALHQDRRTPVVLLSAGVGLTPMVAMLNDLVGRDEDRQIRFVHGCRHAGVHAMKDHVNTLASDRDNLRKVVFYEQVGPLDRSGEDYDHVGRINLHHISELAILPGADYYLCGPLPFMSEQQRALRELGVPAERIHAEAFGTGGAGL